MQFRRMAATFGTLDHRVLTPAPGLNIIEAPNESGKSTLLAFLRAMLYGFPPRERGMSADRNRYAPWSLAPMQGTLALSCRMGEVTLQRDSIRAGDPMSRFTAVYSGSGESVPGLSGESCGEQLLGVPREVYERSAFIRQSGIAVDANAELERRIAALITTGEEGASYTGAAAALKKQLNTRQYHKSGRIPALEEEIAALERSLEALTQLEAQKQDTEAALTALDREEAALRAALHAHDVCDAQEKRRALRRAKADADSAAHQAALKARAIELSGCPPREMLAQGRAAWDSLKARKGEIDSAELACEDAGTALRAFDTRNAVPSLSPLYYVCLILGILSAAGLAAGLVLKWPLLHCGILLAASLTGAAAAMLLHTRQRRAFREREEQRRALLDALQSAIAAKDALLASYDASAAALLALIPAGSLARVTAYLSDALAQYDALDALTHQADSLRAQYALLAAQCPPPAVPDEPVERPAQDRAALQAALSDLAERRSAARRTLDVTLDRCRAAGERSELGVKLAQKREALSRQQAEYDAIALAMDALQSASTALQSRFSPALSRRAGELFSRLTGGKYERVLLDRTFGAQTGEAGETVAHDAQYLSFGALDQLYLAVRLAICETVLPQDDPIPLVLDDALVRFDDARCHAALELLLEESRARQILLFTCQHREAAYLSGRAGVTVLNL